MSILAINGGKKVRTKPFEAYNTIGKEEEEAALRVLRSGKLSTFLGTWHDDFYGGIEVRALEEEWAEYFGAKHAISVNSATSGLFCAVGASGINPGDEIIVSAYTMSASAVAAIVYGAIPVFADIEEDYYTLDVTSIKKLITSKTKAIIVVDIFGQVYDVEAINTLAKEHNLIVIEDAAQAPDASLNGKKAGTFGDMGIFSLNYHKHIHTGEGGIIVTDSDELADKLHLIRNHAEAVLDARGVKSSKKLINMVGFNYRLSELHAAIAREQLKKLPNLIEKRIENANYLNQKLSNIGFLKTTAIRENSTHAFYVQAMQFDENIARIDRAKFVTALKAELPHTKLREESDVLIGAGYVKPLYLQPMYQKRIAFGSEGYPFNLTLRTYQKGLCPVTELMHEKKLITHELMRPPATSQDLDDVANAFYKVADNLREL